MPKKRIPIPPELAARLLFAADRTCCICRDPSRKVEIHHIDEDPSNNRFGNLAVVCKDCQSDAHTNHAFARNLTSETVTLYNNSWRSIVASRLNPGSTTEACGFRGAAFGDFAFLLGTFESRLRQMTHSNGHDWIKSEEDACNETYNELPDMAYSRETWNQYRRLFEHDIPVLVDRLERLLLLYADVVPITLKSEVMMISRVMPSECQQFLQIPTLECNERFSLDDLHSLFRFRFIGLMGTIKHVRRVFQAAYKNATDEFELASLSPTKTKFD